MSTKRHDHTATLLKDGRVLVIGGTMVDATSTQCLDTTEIYTPGIGFSSGTWASAERMSTPRSSHTATLLANGHVLVAGGYSAGTGSPSSYLSSAEVYNPELNTWSKVGSMQVAVRNHAATRLSDGSVLITGGQFKTGPGSAISTATLYDIGTSTESHPMSGERETHTATLLRDGRVLVAGGRSAPNYLNSSEIYDPLTDAWGQVGDVGNLSASRNEHAATRLSSGEVLVSGGRAHSVLKIAERFDPTTASWTTVGEMITARYQHTSTLLPNGEVLIVGGNTHTSTPQATSSTELYEPSSGTWTHLGNLGNARMKHTATRLSSGHVLVVGGLTSQSLRSTEIFEPDVIFQDGFEG